MKKGLVSIIVPVYNVEQYVGKCLDSLIKQTYHNIEIIVINDGSTDSSGEICDKYAENDRRIKVVHQENCGLSVARNVGLELQQGEYISFVDSDDFVSVYFIESMLKCMVSYDVDAVQCMTFSFLNEMDVPNEELSEECVLISGKEMCHHMMMNTLETAGIVPNKLYKASVFDRLRFLEGKLHEDEFIIHELLYFNSYAVMKNRLYFYRSKRENSITHSEFSEKRLDGNDATMKRIEFFINQDEESLADEARVVFCRRVLDNNILLKQSSIVNKEKLIKNWLMKARDEYRVIALSRSILFKSRVILFIRLYICNFDIRKYHIWRKK